MICLKTDESEVLPICLHLSGLQNKGPGFLAFLCSPKNPRESPELRVLHIHMSSETEI